jgi:hypothetical protein
MGLLAGIHAGVTCFMVGLIWFVQVVHYPLLASLTGDGYGEYHMLHARLTTRLVVPVMAVEGVSAALLLVARPAPVPPLWLQCGLALAIGIWMSTALVQVPAHQGLCRSFEAGVHRRLVRSNWLRTIAWSIRGVLSLGIVFRLASQ